VTESRTRLLRGFTHDVKNPLGAADGYLALLEDGVMGDLATPQRQSIERSRRAIRVALDLIDHLLELARAETGQLELERVAMDVRASAREVVEEFRAQAEMKRLALTLDLLAELPTIESDPARVRQILANLISNSVKFTPEGGHVTVRVETRSGAVAPGPGEWVAAEVTDTGPGISAEQQAMVFQEFSRFAPSAVHGTGIGLAISQRIAHALGGVITLESEVGVGSTFTLWLPLHPGTPLPPA
jgi:signal transduction histidine kinase